MRLLLTICTSVILWSDQVQAQEAGTLSQSDGERILREIARTSQVNADKIGTLRGKWIRQSDDYSYRADDAQIFTALRLPESVKEMRESKSPTVEFVFDRSTNTCLIKSNRQMVKRFDAVTGEILKTPGESWIIDHFVLSTPERYLHVEEVGMDDSHRAIHKGYIQLEPSPIDESLLRFADPRRFYVLDGADPLWSRLSELTGHDRYRTGTKLLRRPQLSRIRWDTGLNNGLIIPGFIGYLLCPEAKRITFGKLHWIRRRASMQ